MTVPEAGPPDYRDGVNAILRKLTFEYDSQYGYGSMSCTIYDSAWVSMLTRPTDGKSVPLFPQCFEYVLRKQRADGGWEGYAGVQDSLLNTMAALLAMKKRRNLLEEDSSDLNTAAEITVKIERAKAALDIKLCELDTEDVLQVGFEIIAPAMLRYLEGEGFSFTFPGRGRLEDLEQRKLSKFSPQLLEQDFGRTVTAVHSLEAFVGKVDFDKLEHLKTFGSMMASPSSTAAYLMHVSTWDDECEQYLRHVVTQVPENDDSAGGVPSAFPSTYFEYCWVTSTLLENGFRASDLDEGSLRTIATVLEAGLKENKGLLGFAPSITPDADDTAKAIVVLNLLGRPCSATSLIRQYEAEDHFRTYALESSSSLSVNCNVLDALLHSSDILEHQAPIIKCAQFISTRWWTADTPLLDKWNKSSQYVVMLMCQALNRLLRASDQGLLPNIPDELVEVTIPVALFQSAVRTMHAQRQDGSWSGSREQTAYAILSLAKVVSCPFAAAVREEILSALEKGREFLTRSDHQASSEYLWIEKVTYFSPVIRDAYILAAMKVPIDSTTTVHKLGNATRIPIDRVDKYLAFWSRLPMYETVPQWNVKCSIVEGYLFLPKLERARLEIFSRKGLEKDKYIEYIPFSWTGANNMNGYFFSASVLYDMMVLSLLNYQVDEFMESVVGKQCSTALPEVRRIISHLSDQSPEVSARTRTISLSRSSSLGKVYRRLSARNVIWDMLRKSFSFLHIYAAPSIKPQDSETASKRQPTAEISSSLDEVQDVLQRFFASSTQHPRAGAATPYQKRRLQQELTTFLHAHVQQAEDNQRLKIDSQKDPAKPARPDRAFYDWVRTTSAQHTSCPYSFQFLLCLFSHSEHLETAEEHYVAQDVCTHLATLCRIYNDYGSVVRDRDEENLNSLDFDEFSSSLGPDQAEKSRKKALWAISEYERHCFDLSIGELGELLRGNGKSRLLQLIRLFCNVTDTYGQVYVVRDIGMRT